MIPLMGNSLKKYQNCCYFVLQITIFYDKNYKIVRLGPRNNVLVMLRVMREMVFLTAKQFGQITKNIFTIKTWRTRQINVTEDIFRMSSNEGPIVRMNVGTKVHKMALWLCL